MEKQEKVVDASVVIKWFLNEKDSEKARILRNDLEGENLTLIAPDLLFLEVLNALKYKKIKKEHIEKANEILNEIGLKIIRVNKEILSKTVENSAKHNITIYDALYVTLAQIYGVFLVTADMELYKIPNVIPLEKI